MTIKYATKIYKYGTRALLIHLWTDPIKEQVDIMRRFAAIMFTWMLLGTLATTFLAGPATAAPMTVHWLADGTTQKTITFNDEGYDSTITLSIKKMSTVSGFTMDVEGLPKSLGGTMETDHTFNASTGVSGWDDNLASSPPTQVGECKANAWPFKYSQMFTSADDASILRA